MAGPDTVGRAISPLATPTNDGWMPAGAAAKTGVGGNIKVYVATDGDDNNAGTSPDAPLATPLAGFNKINELAAIGWLGQCKLYFAPGEYEADGQYLFLNVGLQIGAAATPVAIVGGYTSELGDLEISAVVQVNDTVVGVTVPAGAGITENQYEKYFLADIVDGAVNSKWQIIGNTASSGNDVTFYLNVPADVYGGNLEVGNIINIQDCDVTINLLNFTAVQLSALGIVVGGMVGIKWVGNIFNFFQMTGIWQIEGCRFENGIFMISNTPGSEICTSPELPGFWAADGADNPFSGSRCYAGVVMDLCTLVWAAGAQGTFGNLALLANNGSVSSLATNLVTLLNPHMKNASLTIDDTRRFLIAGFTDLTGVIDLAGEDGAFIYVTNRATLAIGGCTIEGAAGVPAITVNNNSMLELACFDDQGDVDGVNLGTQAVLLEGSSLCLFDPTRTTISGGSTDITVGATNKTWGSIGANGFTEANAGGSTLNRAAQLIPDPA